MQTTPINKTAKDTQLNAVMAEVSQLHGDISDGSITARSACGRLMAIQTWLSVLDDRLQDQAARLQENADGRG